MADVSPGHATNGIGGFNGDLDTIDAIRQN